MQSLIEAITRKMRMSQHVFAVRESQKALKRSTPKGW